MINYLLPALLFGLFSYSSFARCPEGHQVIKGTQITQGEFAHTETCFLKLGPRQTSGLVYRTYLFTSNGLMMTFDSFGPGRAATHTGSSEFIFLPWGETPRFRVEDNELIVTMANGGEVVFDIYHSTPLDLVGGEIEVEPIQRDKVQGGVRILSYPGVYLDLGFQVGMSPSWYLYRDSTFKDHLGEDCSIKNREFFVRKRNNNYYRYPTNQSIKNFLFERCPELSL